MPSASSSFATTEVRAHNGVPTIFVDGQPIHGMTATSVAFDDPQVVRDFVAGGVEVMMIWIEAGIQCNPGPDKYNWSYAEKKLRFFEEHSGDTKWVIRVRLGLQNDWFRRAHPTEVHNPVKTPDEPSGVSGCVLASPVWQSHVKTLLAEFVNWLKTTRWASRVIGFMLNAGATEEWLIFDVDETTRGRYHPVYVRELRNWLRKRYAEDQARLRDAWGNESVTFETASPPGGFARNGSHIWGPFTLRDPKVDRQAIDYYLFLNETLADALISFCRTVKEVAGTPIIVGGFHSYLWWESGVYSYIQEYGHTLVQRLNDSPWIDFISDITSYDNRWPGGPSGYLGLPHCQNLHGKLHYTEVDLRTVVNMTTQERDAWKSIDPRTVALRSAEPAIADRRWTWDLGYCGRDEAEQVALLQREHMHNLITGTPYWWFDIAGHNYQLSSMVGAMRQLSDIGKRATGWDRRSISEVAFVCSEDTPMRQSAMSGTLLRFELESAHPLLLDLAARGWGAAGVPFDVYELHDLAHPNFPGEQYKLIIFVNCAYVSDRAAAGVRRWQKDGRVLLWTFAAAVMNDDRIDPALGADLIGMKLDWRRQRRSIRVCMDKECSGDPFVDHPLVHGGSALNFGTQGAVGPVFFVNDPAATVLGHLRDGGEPAFALRDHGDWTSVYLAMLNFGPELTRNLARFAGAHVWSDGNDVVYANRSTVCLHTASAGPKKILLPGPATVTDLWTDRPQGQAVREITIDSPAYRTWAWRTDYATT